MSCDELGHADCQPSHGFIPAAAAVSAGIVYTFQTSPSFKAEQQVKSALLAIWLARMVLMAVN